MVSFLLVVHLPFDTLLGVRFLLATTRLSPILLLLVEDLPGYPDSRSHYIPLLSPLPRPINWPSIPRISALRLPKECKILFYLLFIHHQLLHPLLLGDFVERSKSFTKVLEHEGLLFIALKSLLEVVSWPNEVRPLLFFDSWSVSGLLQARKHRFGLLECRYVGRWNCSHLIGISLRWVWNDDPVSGSAWLNNLLVQSRRPLRAFSIKFLRLNLLV